jgi:hypothetical protein
MNKADDGRMKKGKDLGGVVCGTVIHHDEFIIDKGLIQDRRDGPSDFSRAVVRRDDDAY